MTVDGTTAGAASALVRTEFETCSVETNTASSQHVCVETLGDLTLDSC